MPWQERSTMSLRYAFVHAVEQGNLPFAEVCRRFEISRRVGYKWWQRYQLDGLAGLVERSRRPATSPARTAPDVEARVLALRDRHPTWGGRKIRTVLVRTGLDGVPSASTITEILRRHGRLDLQETANHTPWQRFEHARPNDLWQLDFKGHIAMTTGRCHPLSVLDDHSRYALGLFACANEQDATVRRHLTTVFRYAGLPWRILTDNGGPWGNPQQVRQPLTAFSVWLLRLGIAVSHGRILHPQTQGKVERFHRTLKAEVFGDYRFENLPSAQTACDAWRTSYNHERPHQALDLAVPASRYQCSPRPFPETLPPVEYPEQEPVRSVYGAGQIRYQGCSYYISQALYGQRIALRPTTTDGILAVYFSYHRLGELNLHTHTFTMLYGRHPEV